MLSKSETKRKVLQAVNDFEKDNKTFEGPLKELLMERKNLADRERKVVDEIKAFQDQMQEKFLRMSHDVTKFKGALEYVEEKIINELEKLETK